jgi:hypothetical protein
MCARPRKKLLLSAIISHIEAPREWPFHHDFAPSHSLAKSEAQQKYYEIAFQLLVNSIYSFQLLDFERACRKQKARASLAGLNNKEIRHGFLS